MAGTFYPGGRGSTGLLSDAQRIRAIGRGVVKGARPIGNPTFPIVFWTTSAGLGGGIAIGPEIYAGAQQFGYAGLGEYLTHLAEIGEFLDAATADLPAVTSSAGAAGAVLNIIRTAACGAQDDQPWYCF